MARGIGKHISLFDVAKLKQQAEASGNVCVNVLHGNLAVVRYEKAEARAVQYRTASQNSPALHDREPCVVHFDRIIVSNILDFVTALRACG